MATVRIQKLRSKKTPWQIFQAVHERYPTAFFLDSPLYQPPAQRYSYIGWSPFAEVRVSGRRLEVTDQKRKQVYAASQLWPVLRKLMRKYRPAKRPSASFFTGGAVGFWGYELAGLFEPLHFRRARAAKPRWGGVPDLHLGFYRNLIVYDHAAKCYLRVTQEKSGAAFQTMQELFQDVPKLKAFRFSRFRAGLSRPRFERMVRRAKRYIAAGDIYQANLSQRFHFDYGGSALALYGALRTINPSPFSAFLKAGELEIVSSSPERLVSKRGPWCETVPIAGTRPRVRGRERALARELLNNEKERAEHLMLVDLERNDLGRVCRWPTVKVKELMAIEKYSHVLHLVSRITGRMRPDRDVFDLIQAMFPGGTITGCPKIRCMEIIDELEPERRGIYTGSMGYVDFYGNADLNIVIRTLVLKSGRRPYVGTGKASKNSRFLDSGRSLRAGRGFYQAGAGIVHDSDPRREYEETLHKGEAMKAALNKAAKKS